MVRVKKFILSNFTKNFLTLFLPFFVLISLQYIVGISRFSARINLSFSDFVTLFTLLIPDILFATLPLAFIAAIINTFNKLSSQNELIAIFSLSYAPMKIVRFLLPVTLLFSLLFLILSIFITPVSEQNASIFRAKKIYEEKLRILPNKLSQTFGNKHIFIQRGDSNRFEDITVFSKEKGDTQILLSKSGSVVHNKNGSYLNLNNGTLYKYKNSNFEIVNYENMKLYNQTKSYIPSFLSIKKFWQNNIYKFFYSVMISISPLLTLLLLISLGIHNSRYERNFSTLYIFLTVVIIYIPAIAVRKSAIIMLNIPLGIFWLLLSIIIFRQKVLKRY